MKKLLTSLAASSVLLLMGAGCGQTAVETGTEAQINAGLKGQGTVDISDNTYNYKSKTGDTYSMGENVKIPDDFPKDVPVYPGAKVMTAIITGADGGASLTMTTSDPVDKVSAWYQDQLKDWTKAATYAYAGGETRSFTKDKDAISLSVTGENDLTTVTIIKSTM
jgi:hypothetical protein